MSTEFEYRPPLGSNVILRSGSATLVPGTGFKDICDNRDGPVRPLPAGFLDVYSPSDPRSGWGCPLV